MKRNILERLDKEILIFDGAMGTMLLDKLQAGECPENLNLTNRKLIESIHRKYVRSGSDVVETNTFGGSRVRLAKFGLENLVGKINSSAVKIAKRAKPDYVAASVGPLGELLEPYGAITKSEMESAFDEQISSLVNAGADIICIETMMDIREAKIALDVAKNYPVPVIVTLTFNHTPNGYRTMIGDSIGMCVRELSNADILGTNCIEGMEHAANIVKEMRQLTDKYLMGQPNAGKATLVDGRTVFSLDPVQMAADVVKLVNAGANIIGGCCGTNPDYIREIAGRIRP